MVGFYSLLEQQLGVPWHSSGSSSVGIPGRSPSGANFGTTASSSESQRAAMPADRSSSSSEGIEPGGPAALGSPLGSDRVWQAWTEQFAEK